ncbi:hypothetical protein LINPERPRIM_LOCUS38761 [Linum perenne]
MWDRMVLVSIYPLLSSIIIGTDCRLPCTGVQVPFRVYVPSDVVLCNNPLLWELLPQRPKGKSRSCCCSNCCKLLYITIF